MAERNEAHGLQGAPLIDLIPFGMKTSSTVEGICSALSYESQESITNDSPLSVPNLLQFVFVRLLFSGCTICLDAGGHGYVLQILQQASLLPTPKHPSLCPLVDAPKAVVAARRTCTEGYQQRGQWFMCLLSIVLAISLPVADGMQLPPSHPPPTQPEQ